jgi:hypothetical protein
VALEGRLERIERLMEVIAYHTVGTVRDDVSRIDAAVHNTRDTNGE